MLTFIGIDYCGKPLHEGILRLDIDGEEWEFPEGAMDPGMGKRDPWVITEFPAGFPADYEDASEDALNAALGKE